MKVITLCGSIRFEELFHFYNQKLTLEGNVVFSCGVFMHLSDNNKTKKLLERIHFDKINMSDEIFVINKNGYIGNSTAHEISFAINLGKKVVYMEN